MHCPRCVQRCAGAYSNAREFRPHIIWRSNPSKHPGPSFGLKSINTICDCPPERWGKDEVDSFPSA
jgi:hypothetical protein